MVRKQQGWQGTDAAEAFSVGIMQSPASAAMQGGQELGLIGLPFSHPSSLGTEMCTVA